MSENYFPMLAVFVDILGTQGRTKFEEKFAVHQLFHTEARDNAERQNSKPHVIYDRSIFTFSDCAYYLTFYKQDIEHQRKDDTSLESLNRRSRSL
jgi:hypothetical protein